MEVLRRHTSNCILWSHKTKIRRVTFADSSNRQTKREAFALYLAEMSRCKHYVAVFFPLIGHVLPKRPSLAMHAEARGHSGLPRGACGPLHGDCGPSRGTTPIPLILQYLLNYARQTIAKSLFLTTVILGSARKTFDLLTRQSEIILGLLGNPAVAWLGKLRIPVVLDRIVQILSIIWSWSNVLRSQEVSPWRFLKLEEVDSTPAKYAKRHKHLFEGYQRPQRMGESTNKPAVLGPRSDRACQAAA